METTDTLDVRPRKTSPWLLLLLLAVPLLGCGVEIAVKPQTIRRQVDAGTSAATVCGPQPFGSTALDFEAMAKEAGFDLSQGCLKSASFALVTDVTSLGGGSTPSGTRAAARGVVTLERPQLDLACADGTSRSLAAACPTPQVDLASDDLFQRLNACQDAFVAEQSEPLRRLVNACRPKTSRSASRGAARRTPASPPRSR